MSFRRYLGVTALVSTAFLFGCAETDSIEDLDEPEVAPRSGGAQSGGTNGGSSNDYNALTVAMVQATNSPLVSLGTNTVSLPITVNLLAQPGGPALFKYAVQCAVQKQPGMTYLQRNSIIFPAKGHLSTTDDWLSGPLAPAARDDLFACMAALMNPFGVHVDVVFEGRYVSDDNLDHSEFDFKEAGWKAHVVSGSLVHYTVWPTREFIADCDDDPVHVFETRVCGNSPISCGFTMGGVFEDECVETPTSTKCGGDDVLVTHLRSSDLVTLNPTCEAPAPSP